MTYNILQIANAMGVRLPGRSVRPIDTLLTDSRSLSCAETTLFFALHTDSNDGHKYIRDLYNKGVRAFAVDYWNPEWRDMEADFLVTPDGTLKALQKLAGFHRHRDNKKKTLAITGSRGKTTLKEWLFEMTGDDMTVIRSPRSYNSQIGVPLSLWLTDDSTDLAVIEAGISKPGEMSALTDMIDPDIAVLTNILDDHADSFISTETKCREKAILMRNVGTAIFCADNQMINKIVRENLHDADAALAWSLTGREDAELNFSADTDANGHTQLTISDLQRRKATAKLPLNDPHSLENACHAAAVLAALGYSADSIAKKLSLLRPVNTRTDVLEGIKGSLIIRDHYISDIDTLIPAIDFMERRLSENSKSTLIIDSLCESDPDYSRLAQILVNRHIDALIIVGAVNESIPASLSNSVEEFKSYDNALTLANDISAYKINVDERTILIKGDNPELDRVAEALQARRHETVLEVNLDNLVENYNFYRRKLINESTGIVCMVKASGYGAGSYEPARTLQSQGAAYLAVAVLDEGVDLRKAGITMPIMVLNPRVVNYDQLFAYSLEPEIFSFEELEAIVSNARRLGISHYPVHIKLDTGMHRLGFIGEEIPRLIGLLEAQKCVEPVSVFSHLAAADDPAMDDYTLEQFEKFDKWSAMLREKWPAMKRHILNSTGITRFPDKQYEMVRLGICLYGIATMNDHSQEGLRPVSALRTSIIALRDWPAGTTIGYNRKGVCKSNSRIATIPIGYADGINRHLGNGGMQVGINGHRCPTIGNICMDACMIDVTGCGDDVHVGDSVEIFGYDIPVSELSDTLGTIPYEILTSVSTRVKRVYFRE